MSSRARAAVILLGFWAAAYLPSLLAGRTLPARDMAATQMPWRTVWRQQVRDGRLPLWDPCSNQGRPLLANPNAMAAYPGTLLFLALRPEAAAGWHVAAHHMLLLLGCYLLARRSGAAVGAATVAAVATATTGVAWSSATFLNTQASLAWSVLALATAVPPPRSAPLRRALLAGGALGLAFLGGEPVVAALAALAWTALVVTTWRPFPAEVATAAVSACAVAAPVLLPLAVVYPDTLRAVLGAAPGALAADALAPRRWLELLLPNLLGPPLGDAQTGFWAAASFPWQRYFPLVFVGATPLLVLPFARRCGRRLGVWWALAAIGALGATILGLPGAADLAARLPGLGVARYGIKLLLLTLMALPPLVAAGCERLATAAARRRRAVAAALLGTALAVAAVALLAPSRVRGTLGDLYPASRTAVALVADRDLRRWSAGDAIVLALPAAAALASGAAAPLAAATAVAGMVAGRSVLVFDDARRWADPPELVRALPAGATVAVLVERAAPASSPGDPVLARFWRPRAALVPEYGTRWGLAYALLRGPDGLEPARQDLLAAETAQLVTEERAHVARALGADAVVADAPVPGGEARQIDGVWLTTFPATAPAYLARRLLPCEGIPATARALADHSFRPDLDAVIEGASGAVELAGGTITALEAAAGRLSVSVASEGTGFLVVRQSLMRCWRARVDGRDAPLEPVNAAQIGVRLPAGTHTVELLVDPMPAWFGLLGPLLVAVALVATRRAASSTGRPAASDGAARSTPATPPAP